MKTRFGGMPLLALVLLAAGCDLFQVSLADYLREFPQELRLTDIWATHNGIDFRPLEPFEPGRNSFTIVVTPAAGIGIALQAAANGASTAACPVPWLIPPRSTQQVNSYLSYNSYRSDQTESITVTAANGASMTYAVKIIWAKLITNPDEIRGGLDQDYYLKPGLSPIALPGNWVPVGTAAVPFKGSLRGNGTVITMHSIAPVLPVDAGSQGLFGCIEDAVVEDLSIRLDGVGTNAAHSGGLAGTSSKSLIQRVRVSGALNQAYTGGTSANSGGIAGTLDDKAAIYNCVSTVTVSGSAAALPASSFYMGGVAGNEVYTSGGYIINTCASGNVTASSPATVGGITGGGGYSPNHATPNSSIEGCVVISGTLDSGGGRVDYILGQWDGPTTGGAINLNDQNYYLYTTGKSGSSEAPGNRITGTAKTEAELKTQTTYTGLGWAFPAVWKMGASGYPALWWE
ncbi:MAG: hypothetical protein LBI67_05900 [Treponema sp.]|jgi:hypothetical protein|nr:hypothetical protein [Treponema sp.]